MYGQRLKPSIVGIFSASGGSGNTTVAQLVAQIKSQRGHKVFLLSLDPFPIHDLVFSDNQLDDFTDYMAHIMTHQNWLMGLEKMKSIDTKSKVHYLKPGISQSDCHDFDQQLWPEWVTYISEKSDYDDVIIDLNGKDLKNSLPLLHLCTSILYIVRGDYFGRQKWLRFNREMKLVGNVPLLEKGYVIYNALYPNQSDHTIESDCTLTYDEALNQFDKEGHYYLNNHSSTYGALEVLLSRDN
jgi:cellulose biosynthesis protein BcsQ